MYHHSWSSSSSSSNALDRVVACGATARQASRSSEIMSQFGPAFSVEALGYSGASPYQPDERELIPTGCSILITLWRNFHYDLFLGQGW